MLQTSIRRRDARIRAIAPLILTIVLLQSGASARAQLSTPVKDVLGFFTVGGYFFTNGDTHRALGNSEFYGNSRFFTRPKHYRGLEVRGGVEYTTTGEYFFPFQGGDSFTLLGPAFQVTTKKVNDRLRPYFSGGLFYGNVRSEQLGIDRSAFTPSMSFGVEFPCLRYVTLYTGYTVSTDIAGVNTDGFSLGFRLF